MILVSPFVRVDEKFSPLVIIQRWRPCHTQPVGKCPTLSKSQICHEMTDTTVYLTTCFLCYEKLWWKWKTDSFRGAMQNETWYFQQNKIPGRLFENCSVVWNPRYAKDKVLWERVQHGFTRMFQDLEVLSYEEWLHKFGLWSLEERRNRAYLIKILKMIKGFQLFHGRTSSHKLRTVSL